MRIYSPEECAQLCAFLKVPLDEQNKPARDLGAAHRLRCRFPSSITQFLWFSRAIEAALQPRQSCLVWVTGYGVYPSSENKHLLYRLRQSYGEARLLHEAPGHLCLDFESGEVVTLVYLSMLFGWDAHLIPIEGYGRAFIYHHEWIEMGFRDEGRFGDAGRKFAEGGLEVFVPETPTTE